MTISQATLAESVAPIAPTTVGSIAAPLSARPRVHGKFLFAGAEKLYLRGVTYGTFRPRDGTLFPDADRVAMDFAAMARNGINAVRTYSAPTPWMLDLAARHGLRLLVGLHWPQNLAFLDDRRLVASIERGVREDVRACGGHPAVLGFTIANEIPSPIVRWHGRRRVERFLRRLFDACKDEDPDAPTTYVNFPTTEYLDASFVDFVSFNVYLESRDRFAAYLARLQNLAGDRPLVMAEVGLDSRRNGEPRQAESLDWQIRTAFSAGCAGAFVYAWTDEWHCGGRDVDDWDFGLTTRDREPKLALAGVRTAFVDAPFPAREWPRVSVIVCAYNAERTIGECLAGIQELDYPDFEVVVIDDGSTDATADIAAAYRAKVIRTPNRGLSSARNTGLAVASGSIVAYIDSDASPDRQWLKYLAASFLDSSHAGIGGPNIAPPGARRTAQCVAAAPGRPVHVLLDDQVAEHIPGCNMAFRRDVLLAIGGFDPRFDAAGDDVDVCWRIQEQGGTIGFSAAAVVWHHPRNSIRGYWRQQRGYGRAEALLERKWPQKYNVAGHIRWEGRLYDALGPALARRHGRVYHGTWNSCLFQRVYEPSRVPVSSLPLMPEWSLAAAALAGVGISGVLWPPLFAALAASAAAVGVSLLQAVLVGARAARPRWRRGPLVERFVVVAVTAVLHLVQPMARLHGRLRHGLTPWRLRGPAAALRLLRPTWTLWSERWLPHESWIARIEQRVTAMELIVGRGGDYDTWDIDVRAGLLAGVRTVTTVEEHGGGRQLLRFRVRPRPATLTSALLVVLLGAGIAAGIASAWAAAAVLGVLWALIAGRAVRDCAVAAAAVRCATLPEEREATWGPHASLDAKAEGGST